MIFPVLEKLAQKHSFVLKIVGAGTEDIQIKGVKVENLVWNLEREISDFQSLDVGLYPIATLKSASNEWVLGKSGFKAIQYMAVGIPFVMSPIGVCAEIGEPNLTHFNAATDEDWYNSLDELLSDRELREKMGAEARKHCLKHYNIPLQTKILAQILFSVKNNV
jgi:glycosyltransferase involved in cell wall biosynthesis